MSRDIARRIAGFTVIGLAATTLAATTQGAVAEPPPGASVVAGIRVDGNQLRDGDDHVVQLRGANVMGSEYACIQGWGLSDRLDDPGDREQVLDAMETWAINAVRVPINSDCWFGTKPDLVGLPLPGATYRAHIVEWIHQITDRGMVAIADLHWTAPDGALATGQSSMADADTSVEFWQELAETFGSEPNVVFDLFNEPYLNREFEEGSGAPGSEVADLDAAWDCWLDGCTATRYDESQSATTDTYEVAGVQDLVDTVRAAGATNVLLVAGLHYTQYLDRLAVPDLPVSDPLDNIAISFHAYPGNACGLDNNPCRAVLATLATHHPVVIGEFGRADCKTLGIDNFLDFADAHGMSYLGWQWLPLPSIPCTRGGRFELTKNALTGAPSAVGAAVRKHYLERAWSGTQVHVTTAALPAGLAGKSYRTVLTATGGDPAYRWTIAAGALPKGLTLTAGGVISGIPAGPGTATVTFQVLDSSTPVKLGDLRTFTLTVAPMTVATATLPDGVVGVAYKAKLLASGGRGWLTWKVVAGALPPGVRLAASGALSGTPTTPGSYDVTVRVTDATRPTPNTATRDLTIVVGP